MSITALIQAVGQVYQAAIAPPMVSHPKIITAAGGVLPIQDMQASTGRGNGICTALITVSLVTTSTETAAFLLVASRIKN